MADNVETLDALLDRETREVKVLSYQVAGLGLFKLRSMDDFTVCQRRPTPLVDFRSRTFWRAVSLAPTTVFSLRPDMETPSGTRSSEVTSSSRLAGVQVWSQFEFMTSATHAPQS